MQIINFIKKIDNILVKPFYYLFIQYDSSSGNIYNLETSLEHANMRRKSQIALIFIFLLWLINWILEYIIGRVENLMYKSGWVEFDEGIFWINFIQWFIIFIYSLSALYFYTNRLHRLMFSFSRFIEEYEIKRNISDVKQIELELSKLESELNTLRRVETDNLEERKKIIESMVLSSETSLNSKIEELIDLKENLSKILKEGLDEKGINELKTKTLQLLKLHEENKDSKDFDNVLKKIHHQEEIILKKIDQLFESNLKIVSAKEKEVEAKNNELKSEIEDLINNIEKVERLIKIEKNYQELIEKQKSQEELTVITELINAKEKLNSVLLDKLNENNISNIDDSDVKPLQKVKILSLYEHYFNKYLFVSFFLISFIPAFLIQSEKFAESTTIMQFLLIFLNIFILNTVHLFVFSILLTTVLSGSLLIRDLKKKWKNGNRVHLKTIESFYIAKSFSYQLLWGLLAIVGWSMIIYIMQSSTKFTFQFREAIGIGAILNLVLGIFVFYELIVFRSDLLINKSSYLHKINHSIENIKDNTIKDMELSNLKNLEHYNYGLNNLLNASQQAQKSFKLFSSDFISVVSFFITFGSVALQILLYINP